MIDLQQFCSTDPFRPYLHLHKPFSRGDFTYATNGHILIKVPRLPDVPEVETAPNAELVIPDLSACEWHQIGQQEIPVSPMIECQDCLGRGHEHDCPDCTCECDTCDGTGKVRRKASVYMGKQPADAHYAVMIQALPGPVEIANTNDDRIAFRFAGGMGILMGLTSRYANHHKIVL